MKCLRLYLWMEGETYSYKRKFDYIVHLGKSYWVHSRTFVGKDIPDQIIAFHTHNSSISILIRYLSISIYLSSSPYIRNLNELRYLVNLLFPLYIKPYRDKEGKRWTVIYHLSSIIHVLHPPLLISQGLILYYLPFDIFIYTLRYYTLLYYTSFFGQGPCGKRSIRKDSPLPKEGGTP